MKRSRRPQLHVLTDPGLSRGRSHEEIARAALAGGADVVQLRDKTLSRAPLAQVARVLRDLVRQAGGTFVVNDRLDVALEVEADGLHLGPDDLPVSVARPRWRGWLGASARTEERARLLQEEGADYLGVGPVFGTTTKADAPGAIGLEGLARIVEIVDLPVIGIGGIDASNAGEVIRAGAAGVAVISSVVGAPDVEAAVRALRRAIDRA